MTSVVTPAVMLKYHQTFGVQNEIAVVVFAAQGRSFQLSHRVVMAPLTRMRAERDSFAPRPLNAEYYGQRATPGGLIIAEASPVMAAGRGNPATPGHLFGRADRGLAEGGRCRACQGRPDLPAALACRSRLPFVVSRRRVAGGASAVPITGPGMMAMTADGKVAPYETPRALETERDRRCHRCVPAGRA